MLINTIFQTAVCDMIERDRLNVNLNTCPVFHFTLARAAEWDYISSPRGKGKAIKENGVSALHFEGES